MKRAPHGPGYVSNGLRCGGLHDVDVEPGLEHELQLFVAVGNAKDAVRAGGPLHRPTLASGARGHPSLGQMMLSNRRITRMTTMTRSVWTKLPLASAGVPENRRPRPK